MDNFSLIEKYQIHYTQNILNRLIHSTFRVKMHRKNLINGTFKKQKLETSNNKKSVHFLKRF